VTWRVASPFSTGGDEALYGWTKAETAGLKAYPASKGKKIRGSTATCSRYFKGEKPDPSSGTSPIDSLDAS